MIPVICIIILSLNSRPEKNLARKFWKLGRVAYLPMKTDVDGDNLKSLNAPGYRGVAQGMLKY